MRINRALLSAFTGLAALAASQPVCRADAVVAQYHFAGANDLARQTNFASATTLMDQPNSRLFKELVLRGLAVHLADGFGVDTNEVGPPALRPLLDDWLDSESLGIFGGDPQTPMQFVVALRMSDARAQAWKTNLAKAFGGPGADLNIGGFTGQIWKDLWLVRARDWLLAGRGADFNAQRDQFLASIQSQNRPGDPLGTNWFQADIDWPRLKQWFPNLTFGDLKLARTRIDIGVKGEIFHATARVTYPDEIPWQSQPWTVPIFLASGDLISFTAAQDIEPFLVRDPFQGMPSNPFTNQLYAFAMGQIPFQNYMAWPVDNATNAIQELARIAPPQFDPILKKINGGHLDWDPEHNVLTWKFGDQEMALPTLEPRRDVGRDFLLAGLFPLRDPKTNGPLELFNQFQDRTDIVYYDWEETGRRLSEWRFLSEMLPILPRMNPLEMQKLKMAAAKIAGGSTNRPHMRPRVIPSYMVADNWLAGLAQHVNQTTVTEVAKTGPAELVIRRRSPFLFTALEWTLLTHWLGQTPAGPIDRGLLPPTARVTPGFAPPSSRH